MSDDKLDPGLIMTSYQCANCAGTGRKCRCAYTDRTCGCGGMCPSCKGLGYVVRPIGWRPWEVSR